MKKFKIEFDVMFNGKTAKKYRFNVKAENETEAFESAEDIIKSKMKHKIISINDNGFVENKTIEVEDISKYEKKIEELLRDSDEYQGKSVGEMIEDLESLIKALKIIDKLKD